MTEENNNKFRLDENKLDSEPSPEQTEPIIKEVISKNQEEQIPQPVINGSELLEISRDCIRISSIYLPLEDMKKILLSLLENNNVQNFLRISSNKKVNGYVG